MLFKYHYICMDRRIRATQQNVNKGSLSLIERTEFFSIIFVCSKKETSFEIVERKKKKQSEGQTALGSSPDSILC